MALCLGKAFVARQEEDNESDKTGEQPGNTSPFTIVVLVTSGFDHAALVGQRPEPQIWRMTSKPSWLVLVGSSW